MRLSFLLARETAEASRYSCHPVAHILKMIRLRYYYLRHQDDATAGLNQIVPRAPWGMSRNWAAA